MSTRKNFLGSIAVAAVIPVAAAAAATPDPIRTMRIRPPAFAYFDPDKFQSILQKPALHRQVFGIKEIAGGSNLESMNNSIDAYDDALAEGPESMHAVAVLYHGPSAFMALSDAFWNDVLVPAKVKGRAHATEKFWDDVHAGKGNPYLHSLTKSPDDVSIESLVAKGSSFFVCNNVLIGMSQLLGDTLKVKHDVMHSRLVAALVPGSMPVPAGVMALNACQEAKFTYVAT